MPSFFKDYKAEEVMTLIKKDALAIIPLAVLEQHSRHLPISTDLDIAENVVAEISKRLKDTVPHIVTPAIWTGYVMKSVTDKFPVAATIELGTLITLLKNLIESFIAMGFRKIMLINSHGGNVAALPVAMRFIQDKYRDEVRLAAIPLVYSMADKEFIEKIRKSEIGGICHACEVETSFMLYFNKNVDMGKASDVDKMKYKSKYVCGDVYGTGNRVIWSTWDYSDSKSGALGDPTVATKETGEKLFNHIVENCIEFIKEFYYFKKD